MTALVLVLGLLSVVLAGAAGWGIGGWLVRWQRRQVRIKQMVTLGRFLAKHGDVLLPPFGNEEAHP